ncbi:MAG TPA: ATP-grasp domain-containing protein [Phototrophicaceae bacterium]|jgi:hypothetical protein|nr:ATP-grasp domain-containing protein [Phototrophicaceae bacterium]
MIVIFCRDLLDSKQVDAAYEAEAKAAHSLSIDYHLIDFEAIVTHSAKRAVQHVPTQTTPQQAIYRGWMLKPPQYTALYDSLKERDIELINTPAMYHHAHYLPENYPIIKDHTPRSICIPWMGQSSITDIYQALQVFGNSPIIVKDYVKSQKHYWHDACFIPNASDHTDVERVVRRFLELQGDDLNEGLVFREFVEFEPLVEHSVSGMPLTKEFRVFVRDGQAVYSTRYWSEGDYRDEAPEIDRLLEVAQRVNSRFFTMDVARRLDGEWMIVELGDGQVAGLPDHADREGFYRAMVR